MESAGWLDEDAVLIVAEWHGCDVCLFVGPLNSDPDDPGDDEVVAVAANGCCCLQQVNVAAYYHYCCCLYCIH